MKKLSLIVPAIVVFASLTGCAAPVDRAPVGDDDTAASTETASVTREDGSVSVEIGANRAVATEADGVRTVDYFEAGAWVGSVAYDESTRELRIATPGFERAGVLPFDLRAGSRDPSNAGALMEALGMTEAERAEHLTAIVRVDERITTDASVSAALARRPAPAGLKTAAFSPCTDVGDGLACGLLTVGICGWVMIFAC